MNSMFHDFIEKFMQVYIDDIVVKSSSEDDHLNHLRQSFERMRQYVKVFIEGFLKNLILFAEEIPLKRILIKSLITNQTET